MRTEYDAVVVGAGPNGLAAAVEIARAGRSVLVLERAPSIGGGTRTEELTLPGFRHDICSAIHPLGVASPFLSTLPLQEHGLEWAHPEVPLAHPLDQGPAAVLHRSVTVTAEGLGADGSGYRRLLSPLTLRWDRVSRAALGPPIRIPPDPLTLARLGMRAMRSTRALAARFSGDRARALLAGTGAHAIAPLDRLFTGGVGLVLMAAGHAVGWPAARGGSEAIAVALASLLESLGGVVETGCEVASPAHIPPARAVLFDTSPAALARIAGPLLPDRYRKALQRFPQGPGSFKVDWALSEPIPWSDPACIGAGTVHLGGTFEEIAAAESEVAAARHPERPFVLVAQQSRFDSTRAPAARHTAWGYCHVPAGSDRDMTDRIEAQIERFAPGFRDVVLGRHSMGPADLERHNPNYPGGDIAGGAFGWRRVLTGAVLRFDPYRTPAGNVYLCSSSTPPGAGVHGMCGYYAARSALRHSLR